MNDFYNNKHTFRIFPVLLVFVFWGNNTKIAAQSNTKYREKVNVEVIEKKDISFVKRETSDINVDDNKKVGGCWCGSGEVTITVKITYARMDQFPTKNINELAAIFTAGVSFLQ